MVVCIPDKLWYMDNLVMFKFIEFYVGFIYRLVSPLSDIVCRQL
jgi:hypothetical protein